MSLTPWTGGQSLLGLDPLGVTDFFQPFFTGWPYGSGTGQPQPHMTTGDIAASQPAPYTRTIPVDFIEREKEYVLRADIPGVHKDELRVHTEGNVLRIGHEPNPERTKLDNEETGTFHRAERVSSFRGRALRMPDNANMDAINAKYLDGVLEVAIPKKMEAQVQGKRVEVA